MSMRVRGQSLEPFLCQCQGTFPELSHETLRVTTHLVCRQQIDWDEKTDIELNTVTDANKALLFAARGICRAVLALG
jgi:hypothetical protein